jgi:hypothetical protein
MTQFVAVDKNTNKVLFGVGRPDAPDLVGPMAETPLEEGDIIYYPWQGDLILTDGPTPDATLIWRDNQPTWDVTLDQLKAAKNAEINSARLAANLSFFVFSGKHISCDTLSRSDIDAVNGYVTLTGTFRGGWPGAWKAIDNTYVPINTVDDWKAFYGAMVDQGQANFAHAQELKVQLANATTEEEIAQIVW